MWRSFPAVCFAACLLSMALPASSISPQPVLVTGGLVSGVTNKALAILAYRGIPYAAPPVGERRWQAPGPVVPWQGVRKAESFGSSCMQSIVEERKPLTYEFLPHNGVSENCLCLNVWTPATSRRNPSHSAADTYARSNDPVSASR